MLCVLTNDRHFSVMTFPSGVLDDNGQDERGWMFYVIYAYIFTLFAVTYANIMRKSRKYIERRYRLLPLVPIMIGMFSSRKRENNGSCPPASVTVSLSTRSEATPGKSS